MRLNPAAVTVETAGGVAYQLNITLPTYSALEGQSEAVLWVHESIRDDAWTLFGFLEETERELFRQLVGVSGVGAGTARMILSAIPAAELPGVIAGSEVFEEALAALVMLGFTAQQSRKVLGKLFDSEPGLKVEVAIRKALPLM